MEISFYSFGIAKDVVGSRNATLNLPGDSCTVEEFTKALAQQYPELKALAHYSIAVNNAYVSADQVIQEGDEIAVLPPVSGG